MGKEIKSIMALLEEDSALCKAREVLIEDGADITTIDARIRMCRKKISQALSPDRLYGVDPETEENEK